MSTKAIRKIFDKARSGLSITHRDVREAERELAAIRNAAAAITKGGDLSDEMMARGLLERIAEEA